MKKITLEDYIDLLLGNYRYSLYYFKRVEELWIKEDPSLIAFHQLSGRKVINGILDVTEIDDHLGIRYYDCAPVVKDLLRLRKDYPNVTREEFLDVLRSNLKT